MDQDEPRDPSPDPPRDSDEPRHQDHDLIPDAKEEVTGMLKKGLDHPSTKPVLIGAGVGAIIAGVLPVVTWPLGLAAGAGFVLYKRLRP